MVRDGEMMGDGCCIEEKAFPVAFLFVVVVAVDGGGKAGTGIVAGGRSTSGGWTA